MNPTPPEVDRLIAGGPEPTRTRNPTHIGAAALVLALGGLGVHAIMQDGGDDTAPPASAAEPTVTAAPSRVVMGPPPLPSDPGGQPLQAGTYRLLAGFDRIGSPHRRRPDGRGRGTGSTGTSPSCGLASSTAG